jgi:hypothetical protein
MNTYSTLLTLNAGGIIAAIVGLLFGLGGAIYCIRMVASSDVPRERKPWWGGGIAVGALMVVLAILVFAGVI